MEGGWFAIPGVHAGQRTLAEQMRGLAPALGEAAGKRVADLGCAEGLIALEFAKAGAAHVWACDFNAEMLALAQAAATAAGVAERTEFAYADIGNLAGSASLASGFDIVLALAIVHKLEQPRHGVELVADICRGLAVFRLPESSDGVTVRGKRSQRPCNLPQVMQGRGFVLERVEQGPRTERVQYWRRKA